MGTDCQVDFAAASLGAARSFAAHTQSWVADFEARFSRFRPDSLVSRINAAAGRDWVAVDAEAESLLGLCDWYHRLTGGVFDPATLPLLALWDYHAPRAAPPSDAEVGAARARCGWSRVRREPGRILLPEAGMGLDLGGIGKEYAVDRVIEMAMQRGIRTILVNFGHDLRVLGDPPEGGAWRIGLEDPRDPGRCWTGLLARDRAVTTSGDYLRHLTISGRRYGHILDPRTGQPVSNGCESVSVVAPTCTEAGMLSTAAFVMGAEEGLRFLNSQYQAEGCLWQGSRLYATRRFRDYLIRPNAA